MSISADLVERIAEGQPSVIPSDGCLIQPSPPTLAQWQSTIEAGQASLCMLQTTRPELNQLWSMFSDGLNQAASALELRLANFRARHKVEPEPETPLPLWDSSFSIDPTLHEDLAQALPLIVSEFPGLEYVVRRRTRRLSTAIYIPGIGSLETAAWRAGEHQAEFVVGRSIDLNEHFMDGADEIELPEQVWIGMNSCMSMSSVQDRPSPVTTLVVEGRMLAISSTLTGPGDSHAMAWALVDARQWHGDTTLYGQMVHAYESGHRQRGDMRGLQVSARGRNYVIAKPVVLVDYRDHAVRRAEAQSARELIAGGGPSARDGDASRETALEQLPLF